MRHHANTRVKNSRSILAELKGRKFGNYEVAVDYDIRFTDAVDGSVSNDLGIRSVVTDDWRFVFRLSGTGTQGATLRLYVESYEPNIAMHSLDTQEALKELIEIADQVAQIKVLTGREQPTVIT